MAPSVPCTEAHVSLLKVDRNWSPAKCLRIEFSIFSAFLILVLPGVKEANSWRSETLFHDWENHSRGHTVPSGCLSPLLRPREATPRWVIRSFKRSNYVDAVRHWSAGRAVETQWVRVTAVGTVLARRPVSPEGWGFLWLVTRVAWTGLLREEHGDTGQKHTAPTRKLPSWLRRRLWKEVTTPGVCVFSGYVHTLTALPL